MYLGLLNEKEKEGFLGLAYNLAVADGDYSAEEKKVIYGYCQEMQFLFDENTMVRDTEELLNEFSKGSGDRVKRIVVFELIGLAMSDGSFGEDERKMISLAEKKFGIDEQFTEVCEEELSKYIDFQTRLNQIILG